jgi:hypothetical protein
MSKRRKLSERILERMRRKYVLRRLFTYHPLDETLRQEQELYRQDWALFTFSEEGIQLFIQYATALQKEAEDE